MNGSKSNSNEISNKECKNNKDKCKSSKNSYSKCKNNKGTCKNNKDKCAISRSKSKSEDAGLNNGQRTWIINSDRASLEISPNLQSLSTLNSSVVSMTKRRSRLRVLSTGTECHAWNTSFSLADDSSCEIDKTIYTREP